MLKITILISRQDFYEICRNSQQKNKEDIHLLKITILFSRLDFYEIRRNSQRIAIDAAQNLSS